jgi:hypothetical protein
VKHSGRFFCKKFFFVWESPIFAAAYGKMLFHSFEIMKKRALE